MNEVPKRQTSVPDLLGSLLNKTGILMRQEMQLVSTEVGHKSKRAMLDLSLMLLGGAVAHAGFLTLIFGAVVALSAIVATWLAAVVLGGVVMGFGVLTLWAALKAFRRIDRVPKRTLESFQDDKDLLKGAA